MKDTEIRAHALTEAVKMASLMALTVPEILEYATTFEAFIRTGAVPEPADAAPEPEAAVTVDTPDEVWGAYCVRCGHSSGIHTTEHGCNASAAGGGFCPCPGAVLAPEPVRRSSAGCTCHRHDHLVRLDGRPGCERAGCYCVSERPRG